MNILTLFCEIDDFFLAYEKWVSTQCLPETTPLETRGRPRQLHPSEVMTLLIAFHQSNYRTLKHFYLKHVCVYWGDEFPHLVSYSRFVQLQKEVLTVLMFYLSTHLGTCIGISFVDSTRLRVCDNRRISSHRVFVSEAGCSKTSMGWFYGFKLHLVINEQGEILDVELTPGNTDDRRPLPKFTEGLHGNLYADRGYISKDLREQLRAQGINLVYKVRKNMKPLDLSVCDEVLLRKRMLIESVIRVLKTQTQLEHSRKPRSFENFQVNVVSALIAYQLCEKKPSLNIHELQDINDLPMLYNP